MPRFTIYTTGDNDTYEFPGVSDRDANSFRTYLFTNSSPNVILTNGRGSCLTINLSVVQKILIDGETVWIRPEEVAVYERKSKNLARA